MNIISRALTLLGALAVTLPGQQTDLKHQDIRYSATPNVSVRLNGALGAVKVVGWDKDSVALVGGVVAGTLQGGAMGGGAGPVTGMKYYVEADEAGARSNKVELHVPRGARVWIKCGSADIDVSGVTGGLDLNIIGGSIKVGGKPRELVIEAMDGTVAFDGVADYGRIKTATGDITLTASGDDIQATSISGNVTANPVKEGAFSRARFETVSGTITFAGEVARGGDVRFDTHSGAIELRLKAQANVEIDAESITGSIDNQFTQKRASAGREGRGMQLWTSSGIGGASVQVRSFKGNVKLTTR